VHHSRGDQRRALFFNGHGAALPLIEQNKFKKDQLRSRACIPVRVYRAWFHQQGFTGLQRGRLFSLILNNHLAVEDIKDHLAVMLILEGAPGTSVRTNTSGVIPGTLAGGRGASVVAGCCAFAPVIQKISTPAKIPDSVEAAARPFSSM
jgi:hypothetical protein